MPEWEIARQRTAIGRGDLSMPLRLSLRDNIIGPESSILDYGCGRGQDVARLCRMGLHADGWDPFYAPDTTLSDHDVVVLNYVLNVIEDATERRETLDKAWQLASKVMVVSCRLKWELSSVNGTALGDGLVTSRNTFQHFYSPSEIRRLVEEVTGRRCVSPSPGVVYAFRHDEDRFAYLARGTIADFEWASSQDYASAVAEIVSFTEERGRPPVFEEIPPELLPLLGQISRRSMLEVINKGALPERVAAGVKRSTLDTLLYLGTSIFNGRGESPMLSPPRF